MLIKYIWSYTPYLDAVSSIRNLRLLQGTMNPLNYHRITLSGMMYAYILNKIGNKEIYYAWNAADVAAICNIYGQSCQKLRICL